MVNDMQYFCPQCQSIELDVERPLLVDVDAGYAACHLCGWRGKPDELLAGLCPENADLWTSDRVANAMMLVAVRTAAQPLIELLEMMGMVPRVKGSEEEQRSAAHIRGELIRIVLGAYIPAAFEAASRLSPEHFARFDRRQAEAMVRVFSYGGERQ